MILHFICCFSALQAARAPNSGEDDMEILHPDLQRPQPHAFAADHASGHQTR